MSESHIDIYIYIYIYIDIDELNHVKSPSKFALLASFGGFSMNIYG